MNAEFMPRARIERMAVRHWRRDKLEPGFEIDALVDRLDLGILWEPMPMDAGVAVAAELDPSRRVVRLNEDLRELLDGNAGFYRFTVAHEIGHWDLHCLAVRQDVEGIFGEDTRLLCRHLTLGQAKPPEESTTTSAGRREHQANLFATYLLAPTEIFLGAYREIGCDGWGATYRLAGRLGLSAQATLIRLTDEGLGHRGADGAPRPGRRPEPGQIAIGF